MIGVLKEIETATAKISLLDGGVIRVGIIDGATLTAESLEENYMIYCELMEGDSAPFLIIVNETATIETSGREEYNKKTRKEVRKKDALVIKNPATMLLINSQIKFVKPIIPTRVFLDEASALRWLLN
ncbi:MAG: hypothetical protein RIC15_12490 [Vicingaceae bacterium]